MMTLRRALRTQGHAFAEDDAHSVEFETVSLVAAT